MRVRTGKVAADDHLAPGRKAMLMYFLIRRLIRILKRRKQQRS